MLCQQMQPPGTGAATAQHPEHQHLTNLYIRGNSYVMAAHYCSLLPGMGLWMQVDRQCSLQMHVPVGHHVYLPLPPRPAR